METLNPNLEESVIRDLDTMIEPVIDYLENKRVMDDHIMVCGYIFSKEELRQAYVTSEYNTSSQVYIIKLILNYRQVIDDKTKFTCELFKFKNIQPYSDMGKLLSVAENLKYINSEIVDHIFY